MIYVFLSFEADADTDNEILDKEENENEEPTFEGVLSNSYPWRPL